MDKLVTGRTTGEGERQMFDLDISGRIRLALQSSIDELGSLNRILERDVVIQKNIV